MVISSFIVEAHLKKVDEVKTLLKSLPGVEVHSIIKDIKIIVTLETDTIDQSYRIGEKMSKLSGVISLCLIYTNFEDEVLSNPQAGL
ncbi:nitrate reductase NapD [Evansella vedderi]|uniref:Chaperone NapD n=1 Tax=Evansella vedderi TaxID=38282 RepID=A0ABT9ZVG0_9BACI|nr:chaperone NapD [Evansella vedderi]MDQ0255224.1 nitrate reductase NapD [Evansella vedderi]